MEQLPHIKVRPHPTITHKKNEASEANLRRARIEAKWAKRCYERESGAYSTSFNLVHDIRMAAWLFEKMHAEESIIPEHHMRIMRAQLLRKLAMAELVVTDLMGDPFRSSRGNN